MALGLDDDSCDPGQTLKKNILKITTNTNYLRTNDVVVPVGPSVPRCGYVGAASRSFERISHVELVERRGSRTRNLQDV